MNLIHGKGKSERIAEHRGSPFRLPHPAAENKLDFYFVNEG